MASQFNSRSEGGLRRFLHYARNHKIPVHPETRKIGIVCTLVGWACIAYVETAFSSTRHFSIFSYFFNFLVQFGAGTLCLFIASLCLGKEFLKIKESTDSRKEDQSQRFAYLSIHDRKALVFYRGLIAIVGYILYSLATTKSQVIDNSSAFSTDALFYIAIMYFILRIKVSWLQVSAAAVIFIGVCFIVSLDVSSSSGHPFISLVSALIAAASLAIIILLNSVIIQHEPPLRVAFFQCLIGLLTILPIVGIWALVSPISIQLIEWNQVIHSLIAGTVYAIALIFFFNAFLYTEPFLIVIMGYSVFPFSIFFTWMSGASVHWSAIAGMALILLGGLASVFLQYREDRRNTHAAIAGYPIYLSSLKEKFRALKRDFRAGRLGMFEYMAQRHEFNKLIFEYSEDIRTTDIEEIKIDHGEVIFTLSDLGLKMTSDRGCRSAPLEILNFGSYEKNESSLIFEMINDGDCIFDIGANVGWYTLQFAKRFNKSAIHSFEPIPQTYEILEKNIKLNNLTNIILHKTALGSGEEEKDFFYFRGGSAISSTINLLGHKKVEKIRCKSISLDAAVEQLNPRKIDFLKCDVEGSELSVIRGGIRSITKFLPIIYIELFYGWCEKFGYAPSVVKDLLAQIGYQCYKLQQSSLVAVDNIDKENDTYNFFFLNTKKHSNHINKFAKNNFI